MQANIALCSSLFFGQTKSRLVFRLVDARTTHLTISMTLTILLYAMHTVVHNELRVRRILPFVVEFRFHNFFGWARVPKLVGFPPSFGQVFGHPPSGVRQNPELRTLDPKSFQVRYSTRRTSFSQPYFVGYIGGYDGRVDRSRQTNREGSTLCRIQGMKRTLREIHKPPHPSPQFVWNCSSYFPNFVKKKLVRDDVTKIPNGTFIHSRDFGPEMDRRCDVHTLADA
mmetsp:Transcript_56282/g.65736  ORF Transcript_56282/g.65736 Transcript_56282/m.65736 type:complete len:226 (-) Transcript_56282:121-798(-)